MREAVHDLDALHQKPLHLRIRRIAEPQGLFWPAISLQGLETCGRNRHR